MSSGATAPAGTGPRTIVLPGNGTQAASYTLPPGIFQYVQSVLVQVDATAAPAVRPTLSIAEQSGVVIATKRQGETIPGGDTGSATWALRLSDDGGGGIRFDVDNEGGWLYVVANDFTDIGYGDLGVLIAETTGKGVNVISQNPANTKVGRAIVTINQVGFVLTPGGFIIIDRATNNTRIKLAGTGMLQIQNSTSAPIFEVRQDGSLHGKIGQALVFDL